MRGSVRVGRAGLGRRLGATEKVNAGSEKPILLTLIPSGEMWRAEVRAAGLEAPERRQMPRCLQSSDVRMELPHAL